MENSCFVSLLTSNDDLPAALQLGFTLKCLETCNDIPRFLMATPDSLSQIVIQLASSQWDYVIPVKLLQTRDVKRYKLMGKVMNPRELHESRQFTLLQLFEIFGRPLQANGKTGGLLDEWLLRNPPRKSGIIPFSQVCFLSIDSLLVQDPSELFDNPEEFIAPPLSSWPDLSNCQVFKTIPSLHHYQNLIHLLNSSPDRILGGVNTLLHEYFKPKSQLPCIYGLTPCPSPTFTSHYNRLKSTIKIVTFDHQDRPWTFNRFGDGSIVPKSHLSTPSPLLDLIKQWWRLFDLGQFHSLLSISQPDGMLIGAFTLQEAIKKLTTFQALQDESIRIRLFGKQIITPPEIFQGDESDGETAMETPKRIITTSNMSSPKKWPTLRLPPLETPTYTPSSNSSDCSEEWQDSDWEEEEITGPYCLPSRQDILQRLTPSSPHIQSDSEASTLGIHRYKSPVPSLSSKSSNSIHRQLLSKNIHHNMIQATLPLVPEFKSLSFDDRRELMQDFLSKQVCRTLSFQTDNVDLLNSEEEVVDVHLKNMIGDERDEDARLIQLLKMSGPFAQPGKWNQQECDEAQDDFIEIPIKKDDWEPSGIVTFD